MLAPDDGMARRLVGAIHSGDVDALTTLLAATPGLALERIGDDRESRSTLHLVTDWPGHRPHCAETIALLVDRGADVDARFVGAHRETPLHWAASADDVAAIDALADAGADIEADGAVLTGGTPLSDAVVFANWGAARRLVERGASMTLWQAAALDEVVVVADALGGSMPTAEVSNAAWHACRAGALATAMLLVDYGADLDLVLHDGLSARQVGSTSGDEAMVRWLTDLRRA